MEQKNLNKKNIPGGVIAVSVMYFLLAIVGLFNIGILSLIGWSVESYATNTPFIISGIIFLGLLILDISIGVGLLKRKSWARITAIIISCLAFIGIITGVVQLIQGNNAFSSLPENMGVFMLLPYFLLVISGLYLLLNKSVKNAFRNN
ncbi:MAG: hypothetical protein Q7R96_03710 [Nanoarchaeota archaeon]|nr:hypothetical protein [Nanoarchaeota archaeon]